MHRAGTDICSLFAGHNTMLPVYEGEIQCLNLGSTFAGTRLRLGSALADALRSGHRLLLGIGPPTPTRRAR